MTTWLVRYMRYHAPGEYEAGSLSEAVSFAMNSIEEGTCAPTEIVDPDGRTVVDEAVIGDIYAKDCGRLSLAEIVGKVSVSAVRSAVEGPESGGDERIRTAE